MKPSAIIFCIFSILATIYQHSHCLHLSGNPDSMSEDPYICIRMYSGSCENLTTLEKYFASEGETIRDLIAVENSDRFTTLHPETFGSIKYRTLIVKRSGLTWLDDKAFHGSKDILERLWFTNNNFTQFNFKSLQNLTKLDEFTLLHDSVESLPKDAFPTQPNLRLIKLSHNKIVTLHKGTFENLPKLIYIDLSHNKINIIGEKVFSLPTVVDLWIDLNTNEISSIQNDAFKDLDWRVIQLENNNLTTFDQQVFEPLVNEFEISRSKIGSIYVGGNPFNCDSDILWLVKKTSWCKQHVSNFRCHESGKSLIDLTDDYFNMNSE